MTPSDQFADPATDAREDFAAHPAETRTFRPFFDPAYVAPQAPAAAPTAQDGPKDPEPDTDAPEAPAASQDAPTAPQDTPQPAPEPLSVAYPENDANHPSRLPPAARPVRQGV